MFRRRPRRRRLVPLGLVGIAAIAAVFATSAAANGAQAGSAPAAASLSRSAIPANSRWRSYDEAPTTAVVRPIRIFDVSGAVTNPDALREPNGGGITTLSYPAGGTPPSVVLDYGKDVGGQAMFAFAASSGAQLQATYSETLRNLGEDGASGVSLFKAGDVNRTESYPTTSGTYTTPFIQGGERYERLTLESPGAVTLRSVGIRFTGLRETPSVMAGHFLASDARLNRIWYAGAYTLNLNQLPPGTIVQPGAVNHLHLLVDGAKRDRAVWSGDQAVSDLTDYYVSDPIYARDSLALFLEHPASNAHGLEPASGSLSRAGPLPGVCTTNPNSRPACWSYSASYSLILMVALADYYRYTGDLRFVRDHWPGVSRQMAWAWRQVGRGGLFTVTPEESADWNLEFPASPQPTFVNALYVEALKTAAWLASAVHSSRQAHAWSQEAAEVSRAVNRGLFNPRTGVYDPSATERGSVVQDANVTAILAGIPDAARARRITTLLARSLRTPFGAADTGRPAPAGYNLDISPYMGSFQVFADFHANNEAAALSLIEQEWGYMVSRDPGGVDWERIQLDGVPAGGNSADSSAHSWSTGPTSALSEYVLGVQPGQPGYLTWRVAPQPASLTWAQGVVPTPHGPITARWQRTGQSFRITVGAPTGTSGTVTVPLLGRHPAIWMDGRMVWDGHRALGGARAQAVPGAVAFAGVRGSHTFAWAR